MRHVYPVGSDGNEKSVFLSYTEQQDGHGTWDVGYSTEGGKEQRGAGKWVGGGWGSGGGCNIGWPEDKLPCFS